MGNEGRGTVWEEIIINCPSHIQMLAMSATVANPDDLGSWITMVLRLPFTAVPTMLVQCLITDIMVVNKTVILIIRVQFWENRGMLAEARSLATCIQLQ